MWIWRGTRHILWLSGPYFTCLRFHMQCNSYFYRIHVKLLSWQVFLTASLNWLSKGMGSVLENLMSTAFLSIKRTEWPVICIPMGKCIVFGLISDCSLFSTSFRRYLFNIDCCLFSGEGWPKTAVRVVNLRPVVPSHFVGCTSVCQWAFSEYRPHCSMKMLLSTCGWHMGYRSAGICVT